MIQYNSLHNPNLIMRGRGGPGEFGDGESTEDLEDDDDGNGGTAEEE